MALRPQQPAVQIKRNEDSAPQTIHVTVAQSGSADYFSIVEKTTWNQGIWRRTDDNTHTLTMTGTDVSGILRFKSSGVSQPEAFFLAILGVDTNGPWCDLKFNCKDTDTGALIHQRYYDADTDEYLKKNDHNQIVSTRQSDSTPEIIVQYYTDDQNLKGHFKKRGITITIS